MYKNWKTSFKELGTIYLCFNKKKINGCKLYLDKIKQRTKYRQGTKESSLTPT